VADEAKEAQKRGLFIVLEGPDGAGISTQTAMLQSHLSARGIRSISTKEPTLGPIGSVLRQVLSHRLVYPPDRPIDDDVIALLFAADRLDHIRVDVLPRLESGIHVISDRYRMSSYAYQGATLGQEWVRALNSRSVAPDLTLFIDVPPEVSQQRITSRGAHRELYESEERLRPIYENYLRLVEEARAAGERIIVINGALPVGVVSNAVLQRVLEAIGE
jgi:dTMP kinase